MNGSTVDVRYGFAELAAWLRGDRWPYGFEVVRRNEFETWEYDEDLRTNVRILDPTVLSDVWGAEE